MMTDYMFGTGMDEVVKGHAAYNKTYVYNFNYYSWNNYLPPWRGIHVLKYLIIKTNVDNLDYPYGVSICTNELICSLCYSFPFFCN